jgi:hypothetical protein
MIGLLCQLDRKSTSKDMAKSAEAVTLTSWKPMRHFQWLPLTKFSGA